MTDAWDFRRHGMRKKIDRIIAAAFIAAMLWVVASYIEILSGNLGGASGVSPEYSIFNLFVILGR